MIYWLLLFLISYILIGLYSIFPKGKENKSIVAILTLMLVYFSAFRDGLGKDYSNYKDLCEIGNWSSIEYNWLFNEPITLAIQNFCINTEVSAILFFLISAFFTVYIPLKLYSQYDYGEILIFVFITYTGLYFTSFNLVQQFFAAAIFLLACEYLLKNQYLLYYTFIIVAILIHKSAVILLLIPLISSNSLNKKWWLCLVLVSTIFPIKTISQLYVFQNIIQLMNYDNYLDYDSVSIGKFSITNIYMHIIFIIIVVKSSKLENLQNSRKYYFAIKMFGLSLLCNNISANDLPIAYRISVYFIIFMPIAISSLLRLIPKSIARLMIIIPLIILMGMTIISSRNNDLYCPSRILPLNSIIDANYYPNTSIHV